MDPLHNQPDSNVFSACRQTIPVPTSLFRLQLQRGQVAPFTCGVGCQWKLLLFLCYLAFYVQQQFLPRPFHLATISAVVAATFRCLLLGWQESVRQVCVRLLSSAERKLWLFVAKLNATRCAVSLSTGGESVLVLGGVNCKTNKRMRSSCIKEN